MHRNLEHELEWCREATFPTSRAEFHQLSSKWYFPSAFFFLFWNDLGSIQNVLLLGARDKLALLSSDTNRVGAGI